MLYFQNTVRGLNGHALCLFFKQKRRRIQMDLTKFNEKYRVVSQEAVELSYNIVLQDNLGLTSEDAIFQDLINSYEEQDERIWSNKPIQYFIYEGGTEVFQTTNEEELLREIKRLANRLNIQDESLTED